LNFNQDENYYNADRLIYQLKETDRLAEQLKFVITLLYSLETDIQKDFMNEIKYFENIYSDLQFMREVFHRDALVEQFPADYYGRDYSDDDPFSYKEEIEKKINKISLEIMAVVGRIVKRIKRKKNIDLDLDL